MLETIIIYAPTVVVALVVLAALGYKVLRISPYEKDGWEMEVREQAPCKHEH